MKARVPANEVKWIEPVTGDNPREYTDPYPTLKGKDAVGFRCGKCGGTGIYQGPSSWTWMKGDKGAKWCFDCDGDGYYTLQVATLRYKARRAAKNYVSPEEFAEIVARDKAQRFAIEYAEAWEEAHKEQDRRAALTVGFLAEVGERIRDVVVTVEVAKDIAVEAYMGGGTEWKRFVIAKTEDGHVIKTFGGGQTLYDIERGDTVKVTGTVKKHDTYQGQDQTVLTRAKFTVAG